jgi:hypothetical protein
VLVDGEKSEDGYGPNGQENEKIHTTSVAELRGLTLLLRASGTWSAMAFDTSSHPGSSKEYEGAGMSTVMGSTPLHSGSSKKCGGMGAWSVIAGGQAS